MTTSLSLVVGLLTTALSLLTLVQQNPSLPEASRENARQMAEAAITQATNMLSATASSTATTAATSSSETPVATSAPTVKVTTSASEIAYGGDVTISWIATGASSCTMDSSPVLLSTTGSQVMRPDSSDWRESHKVIYTVTCAGAGGSTSESISVTIQPYDCDAGVRAGLFRYENCRPA